MVEERGIKLIWVAAEGTIAGGLFNQVYEWLLDKEVKHKVIMDSKGTVINRYYFNGKEFYTEEGLIAELQNEGII